MMRKRFLLNTILSATCFFNANSEVRITEIMPCNICTVINDTYNYDGYVEFYNDGGNIDLNGWTVTNIKKGEQNWSVKLNRSHNIPNGYSLLFFGEEEKSTSYTFSNKYNSAGTVGAKLSTDEGTITFEKGDQKITLSYPNQYPHLSYCKEGFMIPTPGKQNGLVTTLSNRVETPTFKNQTPGWYNNKMNVELACNTNGAKIYYTINGDVPTPEKGKLYNGPIRIDSTMSVRARAYKDDMLYSEILTGSYVIPDKYHASCKDSAKSLPIVSITADNIDLYDDMQGMYVEGRNGIRGCEGVANFNQDWTRAANFEYILNGEVVDNQEVEIGVYGGCTRVYKIKSLKIKANKRSGKNKMGYDSFFPNREYKKYKSLALRNGGNGFRYVPPRWRDMYIQKLADGMNLDKQEAQPVAFYLNGAYSGMMILTERAQEDFVYHNYGLDEDEIDMMEGSEDYVCVAGTRDAYNKMIDYVRDHYSDSDFYDTLNTHMDIDEYVDYQIVEQFVGNKDWVTNNIRLWRKHDGGRFRWILFDTDFGLSTESTSLDADMIEFTTNTIKTWSEGALILMRSCLKNEDFKWKFIDQYFDRLENQFSNERIIEIHQELDDLTYPEMCASTKAGERIGASANLTKLQTSTEGMKTFAIERKPYVIDQLKRHFGLGNDSVLVKIRAVFPDGEEPEYKFLLNKREIGGIKYDTYRFSNSRIKVEPIVPYGFKLEKWALNNETVRTNDGSRYTKDYYTTTATSGEVKITIYYTYDTESTLPENISLNEICASNESYKDENGEASDWIELYNGSDKEVDIAGVTIENETKAVRCTIPSGYDETIIPANGYKLLWADKKPDLGPLHLNFKISATNPEKITLRKYYRGNDVELSSMKYTLHNTDESYGRESDGASSMKVFAKCTDSNGKEVITSTPLAANGSVKCSGTDVNDLRSTNKTTKQVFAQGKEIYVQNAKNCDIRVYSLLGNLVADVKSDSDMFTIKMPVSGLYLVKIGSQCWKTVIE